MINLLHAAQRTTTAALDLAARTGRRVGAAVTRRRAAGPTAPAVDPTPRASSAVAEEVLGPTGSYERGFVITAAFLFVSLLAARWVVGDHPLVGVVVPAIVLASLLGVKLRQGVVPTRGWLASTPRCAAAGVACPPLLTSIARDSFSRTERAALATSWAAMLIGMAACAI